MTALDTLGVCDLAGFSPRSSLSSYLLLNTKALESKNDNLWEWKFGLFRE